MGKAGLESSSENPKELSLSAGSRTLLEGDVTVGLKMKSPGTVAKRIMHGLLPVVPVILLGILVFYVFGIVFEVRGGYRSGDEIGFLTGFADRNAENNFDWRYFAWIFYIKQTSGIDPRLPILFNVVLLISLSWRFVKYCSIPLSAVASMVLLPTVFYFFNSYLRDVVFLLVSMAVILHLTHKKAGIFRWTVMMILIVITLAMRPLYGLMYITSFILSSDFFKKYYKAICAIFLLGYFVVAPLAILWSEDVFSAYRNFLTDVHLRDKDFMTVMMIPKNEFDAVAAALNVVLSPLYFWVIPAEGFGSRYDIFLYVENLVIVIASGYGILHFKTGLKRGDRTYRFAFLMILFSSIMAAATITHLDSYRYRLVFIPHIIYFGLANYFNQRRRSPNGLVFGSPQRASSSNGIPGGRVL